MKTFLKKYFELTFWCASLLVLAAMPTDADPHFSFCIFKFIGINFCPGCGLGHSIGYLFHGEIPASFAAHPLGFFAVILILFRISKLLRLYLFSKHKNNYYAIRQ